MIPPFCFFTGQHIREGLALPGGIGGVYLEVDDGRNVVFDLQNYTVNSTVIGNTGKPVLEIWNGYVTMSNGTLNCTAGQAAVNVWVGGFNISGGTVNTTGT